MNHGSSALSNKCRTIFFKPEINQELPKKKCMPGSIKKSVEVEAKAAKATDVEELINGFPE